MCYDHGWGKIPKSLSYTCIQRMILVWIMICIQGVGGFIRQSQFFRKSSECLPLHPQRKRKKLNPSKVHVHQKNQVSHKTYLHFCFNQQVKLSSMDPLMLYKRNVGQSKLRLIFRFHKTLPINVFLVHRNYIGITYMSNVCTIEECC